MLNNNNSISYNARTQTDINSYADKNKKKAIKKILVPLKSNNLTFETKGFIKDLGGNETFFNKIKTRYIFIIFLKIFLF